MCKKKGFSCKKSFCTPRKKIVRIFFSDPYYCTNTCTSVFFDIDELQSGQEYLV